METTPFDHGFSNPLTEKSMNEVLGYTKALADVYHLVKDLTEFNPEKRFIDSVVILDKIGATNGSLKQLFVTEQASLDELKTKILSGTKH